MDRRHRHAIAIAEVAATGKDLRDESAQDAIVARWHGWAQSAKDVGVQTRSVLGAAGRQGITAARARTESEKLHRGTGRTAGNGSLMRTAPVALAYLDDEDALAEAARAVSELTHYDPEAGEACVLWCCAIRHAVCTGELDIRVGLSHIDVARRALWSTRLDEAESSRPSDFANNGWVVAALQAAWSAIATTAVPVDDPAAGVLRADHLRLGLDAAVRAGNDTDTVAAIAGGPARRDLGRLRRARSVAQVAARLARHHRAGSGGAGRYHRAWWQAGAFRLTTPAGPERTHWSAIPMTTDCGSVVSRWAETPAPVGAIADLAFWICGISASFRGELLVADLPARRCDRRRAEGRRRGQ